MHGEEPDAGSLTRAGAGIAGYDSAAAEEKDEVSRALRGALPRARVRVASDARTAHLGAFGGGPGALLVAGTGAVALAVDPAGASYWAGGDALDGAALLASGAVLPVPYRAVSRAARGSGV